MIESQTMHVNERRNVIIAVRSTLNRVFDIEDASFKLYCGNEIEQEGYCKVEDHTPIEKFVIANITPQRVNAIYKLVISYKIPPEEALRYVCQIRTVK